MNPYEQMVAMIDRYHGSRSDTKDRVARELLVTGYNITEDFVRAEVGPPWIYNAKMEEFYSSTDSFIFTLLAWHHQPHRIQWRVDIAERINRQFPDGSRVLSLGDGIGMDAYDIAAMCPSTRVTCFEFDGHSTRFAQRRAEESPHKSRIEFVNDLRAIPRGTFDFVVCLDVLEHVLDPVTVISDIRDYLHPHGHVLLSEAFGAILPLHPTHLLSNLRHAGRTIGLFRQHGFHYLETFGARVHHFARGRHRSMTTAVHEARADARLRMIGVVERQQFRRHFGGRPVDLSSYLTLTASRTP